MNAQPTDTLPINFPARDILVQAGLTTLKQVKDHADLNTVPGLDTDLVEQIKLALKSRKS